MDTGIAIARLLIKEGLITDDQLCHAQRVQTKLAEDKTLLNTLLELEYFTQAELNTVLRKSQLSIRIGDLLVELGDLSVSELEAAIRIQRDKDDGKKSVKF
jgi:type IV pilus assembly protein PilB